MGRKSLYLLPHIRFNQFNPFISIKEVDLGNEWQQPIDSHVPGWKMGLNSMRPVARYTDGSVTARSCAQHCSPCPHTQCLAPAVQWWRSARALFPSRRHPRHKYSALGRLTSLPEAGSSLTGILLVRLAIGVTRILGNVTRTLDLYMLLAANSYSLRPVLTRSFRTVSSRRTRKRPKLSIRNYSNHIKIFPTDGSQNEE